MDQNTITFSELLRRKGPLPDNVNERLIATRAEFDPLSDVIFVFGCAMYAAIPLETSLKMILDMLQELGLINILGKKPFKESIIDSKAMLGKLKEAFFAYLKALEIEIPSEVYQHLDRCNDIRNELAHDFWTNYGNAYNGTPKAEEAIMNLTGCIDIFHHAHIELLDLLDALAKATNKSALAEHLAGMKEVQLNKGNFKTHKEYVEACYTGGKSMREAKSPE